jgi:hypothetical protein
MAEPIPTPVIDSIASILDQWSGSGQWRAWPSVAAKDQMASRLRDDMKANGLSWADSRAYVLGMDKALAIMEHFTGHPDGYRSLVLVVDLLKEKVTEPPAIEIIPPE